MAKFAKRAIVFNTSVDFQKELHELRLKATPNMKTILIQINSMGNQSPLGQGSC